MRDPIKEAMREACAEIGIPFVSIPRSAIHDKPLRVLGAFKDGDKFRARVVFPSFSVKFVADTAQEAERQANQFFAAQTAAPASGS
jgi:hypothetical protein